jgi:hypothetical protein
MDRDRPSVGFSPAEPKFAEKGWVRGPHRNSGERHNAFYSCPRVHFVIAGKREKESASPGSAGVHRETGEWRKMQRGLRFSMITLGIRIAAVVECIIRGDQAGLCVRNAMP